jgi:hypothetical protein
VPLAVLMLAGALLLPLLLIAVLNLESLSDFYKNEINSLYERLGLTELAANSPVDPFLRGSITDVIAFGYVVPAKAPESESSLKLTGKKTVKGRGTNLLMLGFYLILPTAAQIAAGYRVSELLSKAELGWFTEILASIGAFLGVVFSHTLLPHQSSDWISNLFVLLAFITSLVYIRDIWEEDDSIRTKLSALVGVGSLLVVFVFVGAWLGYWVAAR